MPTKLYSGLKELIHWNINPDHSDVAFKLKDDTISHIKVGFAKYTAAITTSENNLELAAIDVLIEANSLFTHHSVFDEFLRSKRFLDTENFHHIAFTSLTTCFKTDNGLQVISGDITIKNRTRRIYLFVQLCGLHTGPSGNKKVSFSITGKLRRSDWGYTKNASIESGAFMLSDDIEIVCELEMNADSFESDIIN